MSRACVTCKVVLVVFGVRDELAEANTQDKNGYYQVRAYLAIFPTINTTYKYSYLDFISHTWKIGRM